MAVENAMVGLSSLLLDWDSVPVASAALPIRSNPQGHRNLAGVPRSPAIIFPKGHPQFVDSLEPGIRDLVVALIDRLDCVTYSSCEGHSSGDGRRLVHHRNVQFIARDQTEYQRVRNVLSSCVDAVGVEGAAVELRVVETRLDTDVGVIPSLELCFAPCVTKPQLYFRDVETLYLALLDVIRGLPTVRD